jgi:hypothetical protein
MVQTPGGTTTKPTIEFMTETTAQLAFLGWPEIVALLVMLLVVGSVVAVVIVVVTRLAVKPRSGETVEARPPGRLTAADLESRLKELKGLLDQGLITTDDYENKKRQLLTEF